MTPRELRKRRRARGLTQAQLAERIGVGRLYIVQRESGARPISRLMSIAVVCVLDHTGR